MIVNGKFSKVKYCFISSPFSIKINADIFNNPI